MAGMVETMVRQALDAFVHRDAELARSIRLADNAIDDLYACLCDELLGITMKVETLRDASQAFNLLFTARHLERIADHATNIAERVIYMVTGHLVSHQPPDAPLPEPAAQ
jgi:phosphate transport system protein